MLMIDMTEEPETEDDLIFKAQNMKNYGRIEYLIPIQNKYGVVLFVDRDYYNLRAKYNPSVDIGH